VNTRTGKWFLKPPIRMLALPGTFAARRCFLAALVVLTRRSLSKRAKRPDSGRRLIEDGAIPTTRAHRWRLPSAFSCGRDGRQG